MYRGLMGALQNKPKPNTNAAPDKVPAQFLVVARINKQIVAPSDL